MGLEVVVKIPRGQRNKYEMDHESGPIYLHRMLFTSTRYPADYEFVAGTPGLDGTPLDALVLLEEPTFPGCVIRERPRWVLWDATAPNARSTRRGSALRRHMKVDAEGMLHRLHERAREQVPARRVEVNAVGRADSHLRTAYLEVDHEFALRAGEHVP